MAVLGVSPTLIRALKSAGEVPTADLSSLRILGASGEPWDEDAYRWLALTVCEGKRPLINFSGGTEVGGAFLSPYPVEPLKVCSLGGPSLGMDVDVFSPSGESIRGAVGELVCKQPWPAMTRGVWRDPERYIESYWSMYPGVWRHGDWARADEDGQWFVLGRSRRGVQRRRQAGQPAEVESELLVASGGGRGGDDRRSRRRQGRGDLVLLDPCRSAGEDVSAELGVLVTEQLGKPFKPGRVVRVSQLPRTRSAKILRRAVRAVAVGEDPGDMSSAENPEALEMLREALA